MSVIVLYGATGAALGAGLKHIASDEVEREESDHTQKLLIAGAIGAVLLGGFAWYRYGYKR